MMEQNRTAPGRQNIRQNLKKLCIVHCGIFLNWALLVGASDFENP